MKKWWTAAAWAMVSGVACASDWIVGAHLVTKHDKSGYQEFNPGVYVDYKGWNLGVYRNSIDKTSVHAGYTFEWDTPKLWLIDAVALTAGVASGYTTGLGNSGVRIVAAPSARIGLTERTSLRVMFVPHIKPHTQANALHLTAEYAF